MFVKYFFKKYVPAPAKIKDFYNLLIMLSHGGWMSLNLHLLINVWKPFPLLVIYIYVYVYNLASTKLSLEHTRLNSGVGLGSRIFCKRYNASLFPTGLFCQLSLWATFFPMTSQICNFVPMSSSPHRHRSHTKECGALIAVQKLIWRLHIHFWACFLMSCLKYFFSLILIINLSTSVSVNDSFHFLNRHL